MRNSFIALIFGLIVLEPSYSKAEFGLVGLVSVWHGQNNARDSVGQNNGYLLGTTTYGNGRIRKAFEFNSVGDGVIAPTAGLPTGTANRTIDCWVFIDSYIDGAESFFAGYGNFGAVGESYHVGAYTDHRLYFSQWGDGIFGPVLNTGQWYHVAVTSIGTNNITLYLNGKIVAKGALSFNTPPDTTFYIGGVDAPYKYSANHRIGGRSGSL